MGYFTDEEFYCPCGECEPRPPSSMLKYMLNEARSFAGIPFIITSGVRCARHNRAVGGTMDSEHIDCDAADIAVGSSWERMVIVSALVVAGFKRIGVAKSFVHAGVSTSKPRPVLWVY